MAEGVGKRIVDALKMQSELEVIDKTQESLAETVQSQGFPTEEVSDMVQSDEIVAENEISAQMNPDMTQSFQAASYTAPVSVNTLNYNSHQGISDFSGMEVPANVAILRQLIAQLPSGVSRQAGALVIKQTMEALGISMKSVLQEAQQLQESINLSSRECQSSILECKKQINNLELQVQNYQKQSNSLNEIISLFVQIN